MPEFTLEELVQASNGTPKKEEGDKEQSGNGNGNFSNVDLEGTDESTQVNVPTNGDSPSGDGSSALQETDGDLIKAIEKVKGEEMVYLSEAALPTEPLTLDELMAGLPSEKIKLAEPTKQFNLDENFKGKNEDDIKKYLEKQLPNYNVTVPFAPGEDKVLIQPKFSDDKGLYMTFSGNDLVGYKISEESIVKLNTYLIDNETSENKDAVQVYDLITEKPNALGTYDDIQLGDMFGIQFDKTSNADPEQALNLIDIIDETAANVYANPKKYLNTYAPEFAKDIVELGGLEGDFSLWPDDVKNALDDIIYGETAKKFGTEVVTQAGPNVDAEQTEEEVYDPLKTPPLQQDIPGLTSMDYMGGGAQGVQNVYEVVAKTSQQAVSGLSGIPNRESFDRILNRTQGIIEGKRNEITKDNLYKQALKVLPDGQASVYFLDAQMQKNYNQLDDEDKYKINIEREIDLYEEQIVALEALPPSKNSIEQLNQLKTDLETLYTKADQYGGRGFKGGYWNNTQLSDDRKQDLNNIQQQATTLAYNIFNQQQQIVNAGKSKVAPRDYVKQLYANSVYNLEYINTIGNQERLTGDAIPIEDFVSRIVKARKRRLKEYEGEGRGTLNYEPTTPLSEDQRAYFISEEAAYNEALDMLENKRREPIFPGGVVAEGGYDLPEQKTGVVKYNWVAYEKDGKVFVQKDYGSFNDVFEDGLTKGKTQGWFDEAFMVRTFGEKDATKYNIWLEEKMEQEAEAKGFYDLAFVNLDPAKIIKPEDVADQAGYYDDNIPFNGFLTDAGAMFNMMGSAAEDAVLLQWLGYDESEISELNPTFRTKMNSLQGSINIINNSKFVEENPEFRIDLTDDQVNNLEVSLLEQTSNVTGGFLPTALEFAAFELLTGGLATPAQLAKLPRIWRFLIGVGREETKMQFTTADFGAGTGAFFYTFGRFTGMFSNLATKSPAVQKYLLAGPLGAMSLEADGIVHAAVDDAFSNGDFENYYNQTYGPLIKGDDIANRVIANTLMFNMYGLSSMGSKLTSKRGRTELKSEFAGSLAQKQRVFNKVSQELNNILDNYAPEVAPEKAIIIGDKTVIQKDFQKEFELKLENLKKKAEAGDKKAIRDLENVDAYWSVMGGLHQRMNLQNRYNRLDPWLRNAKTGEIMTETVVDPELGTSKTYKIQNPEFVNNLTNDVMGPINRMLAQANPNYKPPKIEVVDSNRDPNVRDKFSHKDNTAEFNESKSGEYSILIDLAMYNPGKPLHEINHLIQAEFMKNNPQSAFAYTKQLTNALDGINFPGLFIDGRPITGKSLREAIANDPVYSKKSEADQVREVLSFTLEYLSNPKVYTENPYVAGSALINLKTKFRSIMNSMGIDVGADLNSAGGVIQTFYDFMSEASKGKVSSTVLDRMNELNKISTIEIQANVERTNALMDKVKDGEAKSMASREIVAQNKKVYDAIKDQYNELKGKVPMKDLTGPFQQKLITDNMNAALSVAKQYIKSRRAKGIDISKEEESLIESGFLIELSELARTWDPAQNDAFGAYFFDNIGYRLQGILEGAGILVKGPDGELVTRSVLEQRESDLGTDDAGTTLEELAGRDVLGVNYLDANTNQRIDEGIVEPSQLITTEKIVGADNISKVEKRVSDFIETASVLPETYNEVNPMISEVYDLAGVLESKVQLEDGSFNPKATRLKAGEQKSAIEWIESFNVTDKNGNITENTLWEIMPDGTDASGLSTGVQNVLLKLLYDKTEGKEGRSSMAETGSKAGLPTQTKKDITAEEFVQIVKDNPRIIPQVLYQINKGLTNSTMRGVVDKGIGTVEQNISSIQSGASERLASKLIEGFEIIGQDLTEADLITKLQMYVNDPNSLTPEEEFIITKVRYDEYVQDKSGTNFVNLVKRKGDFTKKELEPYTWGSKKLSKEEREARQKRHYEEFQSGVILDFIPKEAVDAKTSKTGKEGTLFPLFFKFGSESRGTGNTGGELGIKFGKDLANTKSLKELKEIDPELGEAWEAFVQVKEFFEPANSQKMGEFQIGKIKKILEKDLTREEKIKEIEETVDLRYIDAARKFDYAINLSMSKWLDSQGPVGSKSRKDATKFLYAHYQMTTNQVMSDRALAPFTSLYITDGPQTNIKWKGEHNKDSSKNTYDKFELVYSGNYNPITAAAVQKGYIQTLAPKEGLDVMDKSLGVNSEYGDAKFTVIELLDPKEGGEQGYESKIYDFELGMDYQRKNNIEFAKKEIERLQKSGQYEKSGALIDYVINDVGTNTEASKIELETVVENQKNYEALSESNYDITVEALNTVTGDKESSENLLEGNTNIQNINTLLRLQKARQVAIDQGYKASRGEDVKVEEASIFDLDDNLLFTKSLIRYKLPDGTTGELTPEEFNFRREDLIAQAKEQDANYNESDVFDFSAFNEIIIDPSRGKAPAYDRFLEDYDRLGPENTFIMTARAPGAQLAIYEYLKSIGKEIPMENIITTEGTEFIDGEYKGENKKGIALLDFYAGTYGKVFNRVNFTDDHSNNVKSVKDMATQLGIDGDIYQTYASRDLGAEADGFFSIGSGITGQVSNANAKLTGSKKGKGKVIFNPANEDFTGFIYALAPKTNKNGERDAWFNYVDKNITGKYFTGLQALNREQTAVLQDFKTLKTQYANVPKKLKEKSGYGVFNKEQALRVFLWEAEGKFSELNYGETDPITGLNLKDIQELTNVVSSDPELQAFAQQLLTITKGDGWVDPTENWMVGNIGNDLNAIVNTVKRQKYFEPWKASIDAIFTTDNLNKIEAWKGTKFRKYLEESLNAQWKGSNVIENLSPISKGWLKYTNMGAATIMYYNFKSAGLQLVSSINYGLDAYKAVGGTYFFDKDGSIVSVKPGEEGNFKEVFVDPNDLKNFNNFFKMGTALTKTPLKYMEAFKEIWNSPDLVDRRGGKKLTVEAAELVSQSEKGGAQGVLNYLLERGYDLTSAADAFAIASGGATFLVNAREYLSKQTDADGNRKYTDSEIDAIAKQALWKTTLSSQQAYDPYFTGGEARTFSGKMLNQFNNVGQQYFRKQKRAIEDIVAGKDIAANAGTLAYYSVVQSMIFNYLQSAVFQMDDLDEQQMVLLEKTIDSQLRGIGMYGQVAVTLKNFGMNIYERSKTSRPEYADAAWELTKVVPSIGSDLYKVRSGLSQFDSKWERKMIQDKGWTDPLNNPAYTGSTKMIEGITKFPANRILNKMRNLERAYARQQWDIERFLYLNGFNERMVEPDEFQKRYEADKRKYSNKQKTDNRFKGLGGLGSSSNNQFKNL